MPDPAAAIPHRYAAPVEGFDRCAERRDDARWLADQARAADSRHLWLDPRQQALVNPTRDRIQWLSGLQAQALGPPALFLGCHEGRAYFAHGAAADRTEPAQAWMNLREAGSGLPAFEAHLFAYAKALLHWQQENRYCGGCGAPLQLQAGGHRLACSNAACGKLQFPRTDAAIIVLVEHEGACLLGRQAQWEPGRYSTLAGFVEPGESLEDAVRREVAEEAGVIVDTVHYHSSQPWPLPASLMLGFTATARDPAIYLHDQELEDARWLTPAQLAEALAAGRLRLPAPASISYRLIADWLWRRSGQVLAQLPTPG